MELNYTRTLVKKEVCSSIRTLLPLLFFTAFHKKSEVNVIPSGVLC
jgi:hypothetical protein